MLITPRSSVSCCAKTMRHNAGSFVCVCFLIGALLMFACIRLRGAYAGIAMPYRGLRFGVVLTAASVVCGWSAVGFLFVPFLCGAYGALVCLWSRLCPDVVSALIYFVMTPLFLALSRYGAELSFAFFHCFRSAAKPGKKGYILLSCALLALAALVLHITDL